MKVNLASSTAGGQNRAVKGVTKESWRYFFIVVTIVNAVLFVIFVHNSIQDIQINTLYEAHPWVKYEVEHTRDLQPNLGLLILNNITMVAFIANIVGIIAAVAGKVRGRLRVAYISTIVLIVLNIVCHSAIMKIDLKTRASWYGYTICEPYYDKNAPLEEQRKWTREDYFPSSYTCK